MPAKPSISLVIPMFNEAGNIELALESAVEALEAHASDYEIIVVDDASTDRSAELVRRAAESNPRIILLSHDSNMKLGESLRTGFAATTRELILYMDADLPFGPCASPGRT